ncbi:ATP-grasp domain-containing protein [Ancylobacter dichloromethanicus]
MVKPRWGSASIGLARVETAAELPAAIEACRAAIARSILAATGLENAVIVQQCLEGPEYGVDILFGRHGDLLGFAAKRKLAMRAGETDKAVTVAPERFAPMVDALARHLSHRGNLDCDFMEHEGALHLIELNTRFGGGYPFTHWPAPTMSAACSPNSRGGRCRPIATRSAAPSPNTTCWSRCRRRRAGARPTPRNSPGTTPRSAPRPRGRVCADGSRSAP